MGEHNNDTYEQQLLAVFDSCLMKGQVELKEEDLSSLCNKLQLNDCENELKECIQKCIPEKQSISFQEFRDGLVLLLSKKKELLTQGDTERTVQLQQEININNDKDNLKEFPDSGIQKFHMNDCNTKSGLVIDTNQLKDLWQKVNICLKENVDSSDIYYMSNHREISALPKQVAQRIFEKLDQNSDGLISLDEFLDIFKNQTILQEQLILPCKDISQKCLTNSNAEKSNYDTIEHHDTNYIQQNVITDTWKVAGISDVTSLLSHLGYNSSNINLNDLATTLCEELKNPNDSIINTDIQSYINLLKGVLILYKEELRNLNTLIENITSERDKLRVDIIKANERANTLAQEIDEHHLRQEEIKQNLLEQIEHKHIETIKNLSEQLNLERENSTTTLKVKEQQLNTQQKENYQNKIKLKSALQDNNVLEAENESLRDEINKLKTSNNKLQEEIKVLAAEQDEIEHMDEKTQDDVLHLLDRIRQLQTEVVSLRDQNDELTVQLEITRSRDNEMSLQTSKKKVDVASSPEENADLEITLEKEISCNGINENSILSSTKIKDPIDDNEQLVKYLKNLFVKCEDCSCENCDYKEVVSSIIYGQLKRHSFSLIEEIDFSKSLASALETEYEERTSESLRDFVVPKCNKTTPTKKVPHNNNDTTTYPIDANFNYADSKLPQNKVTSLRDYPPRKEECSNADHVKNIKEKDITSNYNVPCNETETKTSTTELIERCQVLERSLDLLRAEYEECENYWAAKLEEERQLFEQEQKISDEKFSELIAKMAEYEELISPVDKTKNDGRLSPIEEKFNLEQQYLDLEEEYEQWKIQAEKDIVERDEEIKELHEKINCMKGPEKSDVSTQILDESVLQRSCTFCNNISIDAFNVASHMQPKTLRYDENTSNITEAFKEDHVLENSVPFNHLSSQVINSNQLQCFKQNKSNVIKCEKFELEEKISNNSSEHTSIEKDRKKRTLKYGASIKDNLLTQDIKPHALKSLHNQCLQDTAQQQICNIDINVLENLNFKLQSQERKNRQLEEYCRQLQHHIEQVLHQTLSQHQIEVSELRCLLYNTQKKLQLQIQAYVEQAERLAGADVLAKDLFIENSYLIANLKRLKQHFSSLGVNCECTSI